MKHKILRAGLWALSSACWMVLATAFYWSLVDNDVPAKFGDVYQPLGNAEDIIDPDTPLIIVRYGCATETTEAVLSVKFVDGIIYPAPDRLVRLEKGCKTYKSFVDIPHTLNAGHYTYNAILRFKNNPLSHPSIDLQSVPFFLGPRKSLPPIDPPPPHAEFEP